MLEVFACIFAFTNELELRLSFPASFPSVSRFLAVRCIISIAFVRIVIVLIWNGNTKHIKCTIRNNTHTGRNRQKETNTILHNIFKWLTEHILSVIRKLCHDMSRHLRLFLSLLVVSLSFVLEMRE